MNKQELIERIEDFPCEASLVTEMIRINKNTLLGWVKELDEPQKPVVPQFVADWIEHTKKENYHIFGAIQATESDDKLDDWIWSDDNMEVFARAWLDGYEIEKEKRYQVKVKGHIQENVLVYGYGIKRYFFSSTLEGNRRPKHTKGQLEKGGFGWVFDCEGIEIEEVE